MFAHGRLPESLGLALLNALDCRHHGEDAVGGEGLAAGDTTIRVEGEVTVGCLGVGTDKGGFDGVRERGEVQYVELPLQGVDEGLANAIVGFDGRTGVLRKRLHAGLMLITRPDGCARRSSS